jgi:predicted DNA-binding protein
MSKVEEQQRETTSIKIKPKVWRETKKQAIDEGRTVSELVEEALEKWIKEHKK